MKKISLLPQKPRRLFYGWWVVLAGTIIAAMGGGFHFYGFTTFFLPISQELNLTRTATSAVFSAARLEGALEGPVVGWLIDRFGSRKLMVAGILLFGAGYIAMYWMNNLLMFFILYALVISMGYGVGFQNAQYALANKWFIRLRSRATGIIAAAIGVGGATIVPLLGWLIATHGWRTAVAFTGATALAVGLPLTLLVRNLPEDKGLQPDGGIAPAGEKSGQSRQAPEVNFTVRAALKTASFWTLSVAFVLRMFVVTGIWVHMVPLLISKGFDQQSAANAVGLLLFLTIPARFVFGWLGDLYPKRYLLMACSLIGAGALGILLVAQSLWQLYLFVVIFALSYGVVPLQVSIIGDYFGRQKFATIRGIITLIYAVGTVTGPIYAGYVYDVSLSYQATFLTFMVAFALGALAFALAGRPRVALTA